MIAQHGECGLPVGDGWDGGPRGERELYIASVLDIFTRLLCNPSQAVSGLMFTGLQHRINRGSVRSENSRVGLHFYKHHILPVP
jgi:hypothetical protein